MTGIKASTQEAKADSGKVKLSLTPTQIVRDIAVVREYGTKKYHDPDNWKKVELQRYIDAFYRHWLSFIEDNSSVDEESGIEHYKHAACNMAFICELMKQKPEAKESSEIRCRAEDFAPPTETVNCRCSSATPQTLEGRAQTLLDVAFGRFGFVEAGSVKKESKREFMCAHCPSDFFDVVDACNSVIGCTECWDQMYEGQKIKDCPTPGNRKTLLDVVKGVCTGRSPDVIMRAECPINYFAVEGKCNGDCNSCWNRLYHGEEMKK